LAEIVGLREWFGGLDDWAEGVSGSVEVVIMLQEPVRYQVNDSIYVNISLYVVYEIVVEVNEELTCWTWLRVLISMYYV